MDIILFHRIKWCDGISHIDEVSIVDVSVDERFPIKVYTMDIIQTKVINMELMSHTHYSDAYSCH